MASERNLTLDGSWNPSMSLAFNTMLTQDRATFHNLLKTYAIAPPNDPGFVADKKVTMMGPNGVKVNRPDITTGRQSFDQRLQGSITTSVEMRKVSKHDGAVWVDLNPWALQTDVTGARGHEGGNTIYMDVKQNLTANHVPIWFLPWRTGAAVRLTIPTVASGQGGSNIFFTAAINGCSVFVQGTPDNPTVTHCGGTTGFAAGQLDEGALFWEAVMDEFVASDNANNKNKGALHQDTVDKRRYVAQPGYSRQEGTVLVRTTARAERYKRQIQARYAANTQFHIEEVEPWGCVLGRRDSVGNWKFFLQENASITYYHMIPRQPPKVQKVAVPMKYREIFPGGTGHHTFRQPLPRLF